MSPVHDETLLLFDDDTGCLTDRALDGLIAGSLGELERLEISEHLSYCDRCLDRYTALLTPEVLIEPSELMKQSILSSLRKKAARTFVNRYFHMAVAASLTMVLWGSGVFAAFGQSIPLEKLEWSWPGEMPELTVSQKLDTFATTVTGGISDIMEQLTEFELRGAFES